MLILIQSKSSTEGHPLFLQKNIFKFNLLDNKTYGKQPCTRFMVKSIAFRIFTC